MHRQLSLRVKGGSKRSTQGAVAILTEPLNGAACADSGPLPVSCAAAKFLALTKGLQVFFYFFLLPYG